WKRCWCWRSGPRPPRRRRPWRPDTRRTRCRCRTSPRRRFRASPMTPRAGSDRCWPRPCRARRTSPVTKCWCNGVAVPTACGCWPPTAAVEGWCRCPVRPAAGTEPAKCWTTGPTAACWSLEESSKASPATAGITSCSRAAVSYGCISSRWRRPARWPTDSGAGAPAAPPAFVGEGEHGAVLPAVAVGMDALVAGQVVAGEDVGDLVPPAVAAGVAAGEAAVHAFQAVADQLQPMPAAPGREVDVQRAGNDHDGVAAFAVRGAALHHLRPHQAGQLASRVIGAGGLDLRGLAAGEDQAGGADAQGGGGDHAQPVPGYPGAD